MDQRDSGGWLVENLVQVHMVKLIRSFLLENMFICTGPNYQPINDQIVNGPSSYGPKLSLHQNSDEIISFNFMNTDHFRVYLVIYIYSFTVKMAKFITNIYVVESFDLILLIYYVILFLHRDQQISSKNSTQRSYYAWFMLQYVKICWSKIKKFNLQRW